MDRPGLLAGNAPNVVPGTKMALRAVDDWQKDRRNDPRQDDGYSHALCDVDRVPEGQHEQPNLRNSRGPGPPVRRALKPVPRSIGQVFYTAQDTT